MHVEITFTLTRESYCASADLRCFTLITNRPPINEVVAHAMFFFVHLTEQIAN